MMTELESRVLDIEKASKHRQQQLVVNTKGNKAHKVLIGPGEASVEHWTTNCGWDFGESQTYELHDSEVLDEEWVPCRRCFKDAEGTDSDSDHPWPEMLQDLERTGNKKSRKGV